MKFNHEQCYAIIKSRDARFDGRFFTAVKTTGIYCRPICPARKPLSKNVRFYPTAAAAAKDGFRPCLRCRPESSPGMADWLDRSDLVSRGVRLIDEGVFDHHGAAGLASCLHVSSRHLQRLFVQHLGASPVSVAQTRRALFARKLIKETTLPMTEIAFSAGYKSVRRFNAAIQATYGNSPTEYRNFLENESKAHHASTIQLTLSYRPPYDWEAFFQFVKMRAIPGVEWVDGLTYARTVCFDGRMGVVRIRPLPAKNKLLLNVPINLSPDLLAISEKARRFFDLRADPVEIERHLQQDDLLAAQINLRPGLRVPGAWDGFELAVRAILGQQITVKAATTLSGRVAQTFGEPLPNSTSEQPAFIFPTAARLVEADLGSLGIIRQRARAIHELAQRIEAGTIVWSTHVGLEEVIEKLVDIPGIGRWTANYIAMRALNEPDAFPAGDLILRRSLPQQNNKTISEPQLNAIAERWRPWRAYAAMQLWAGYSK